jgi:DNA-binding transcriptional MerR regulator
MTIKEVSEKYLISEDTLRYYEKEKLLNPHRKPSKIRDYDEADCKTIEFVTCMRKAGLTIEVLKEYLKMFKQGDKTIPNRIALLTDQLEMLKQKRNDLDASIARLQYKISNYDKILKEEKSIDK